MEPSSSSRHHFQKDVQLVGAWGDLAVLPFTDTVSEHDDLFRIVESTVSVQRLSRHGAELIIQASLTSGGTGSRPGRIALH
jgi:hypothetical protein